MIYKPNVHFTQFKGITKINDRVVFTKIKYNLLQIKINSDVYDYIPELVEQQLNKIKIGNEIKDKKITINDVCKPLNYWLTVANSKNKALIKFKDKFYIEGAMTFIERKRIELLIIYNYQIKNIEIGNFYANRNETNNRLDHNLTGLKKELMQFIIFDKEKTVEIDINNAQFALLANLPNFDLDEDFKHHAQTGDLYEFIMGKLGMTRDEVKKYMMVALFGEAHHHPKDLIDLFPVTMKSITDFKIENGYKSFSILLQNAESNLMIDGVFILLSSKNISTIPVHDSIRVRESDCGRVKKLIVIFFKNKNFKCGLKNK